MNCTITDITIAGLLHDIGKIVYRSGAFGNHSLLGYDFLKSMNLDIPNLGTILDCVRYHHSGALKNARLEKKHPAYIVYEADNIASGMERRGEEGSDQRGFSPYMSLQSVFNLINGITANKTGFPVRTMEKASVFPELIEQQMGMSNSGDYGELKALIFHHFKEVNYHFQTPNILLELLESTSSYVPSSTNLAEIPDISLYDHSKMTAALSAAMFAVFEEKGVESYKTVCMTDNQNTRDEQLFLLVSGDFSGIQEFIYTISGKGAMKSLRGRSFFLEIMTENIIDELLNLFELSRSNLIYSGGGHFYALLPNLDQASEKIAAFKDQINQQLIEDFGISLYLELQSVPCSANALGNELAEKHKSQNRTGKLFSDVNLRLAREKYRRYSLDMLEALFDVDSEVNQDLSQGRECGICKTSSAVLRPFKETEDTLVCGVCQELYDLGDRLVRLDDSKGEQEYFVVLKESEDREGLLLAGYHRVYHMSFETIAEIQKGYRQHPERYGRIYAINNYALGVQYATHIWAGIYNVKNAAGGLAEFSEIADASTGISRIGVLRADVDDLGKTFIHGFEHSDEANPYQYTTLSRYATLSRNMALFFKKTMNILGRNPEKILHKRSRLPGKPKSEKLEGRKLVIVYSGGDDVFIVGAWDEVLEFAIDLYKAFKKFTNGKLHFSAGFGLYPSGYPVKRMAAETGVMEDLAKKRDGKNAITILHETFSWETFESTVIQEVMASFDKWFQYENTEKSFSANKMIAGNALFYRLLQLFKKLEADQKGVNLSRIAYTVARCEPPKQAPDRIKTLYQDFRKSVYHWACEKKTKEVITAITLFVYLNRKEA